MKIWLFWFIGAYICRDQAILWFPILRFFQIEIDLQLYIRVRQYGPNKNKKVSKTVFCFKDFSTSLVSTVGWGKSKLTYFDPNINQTSLPCHEENLFKRLVADFDISKEASWYTECKAKNHSSFPATVSEKI